MKKKVLILGASGMLGSMLVDYMSRDDSLEVTATVRASEYLDKFKSLVNNVNWRCFRVENHSKTMEQLASFGRFEWIINAIGIIKPYSHDDLASERETAIIVNASFPYCLVETAVGMGASVLQIATDCVYSGMKGAYVERDKHDALDVYGKTKSLGEVPLDPIHHLRCSIIGPEMKSYVSFQEWFLRQSNEAKVNGFTNHNWNGVTTLHFAKICRGIIAENLPLQNLQHVIPADEISKNNLLNVYASAYSREDIQITPVEAPTVIDRTLNTENPTMNLTLWKAAGYPQAPPSIKQMVKELSDFNFRFTGALEK